MIQQRRIVCTGLGAVSCCGVRVKPFWGGVTANQAPIQIFYASTYPSNFAAEVPQDLQDNHELFELTGRSVEEATYLAKVAAHQAFQDAGLSDIDKASFGCIVETLCSSSRSFEKCAKQFVKNPAHIAEFPPASNDKR